MDFQPSPYRQQYSNNNVIDIVGSNEPTITVSITVSEVFQNLSDLIEPESKYVPFYASRYRDLGYQKFIWLANKARAGKNPARLFFWMLKNPDLVR